MSVWVRARRTGELERVTVWEGRRGVHDTTHTVDVRGRNSRVTGNFLPGENYTWTFVLKRGELIFGRFPAHGYAGGKETPSEFCTRMFR